MSAYIRWATNEAASNTNHQEKLVHPHSTPTAHGQGLRPVSCDAPQRRRAHGGGAKQGGGREAERGRARAEAAPREEASAPAPLQLLVGKRSNRTALHLAREGGARGRAGGECGPRVVEREVT